MTSNAAFIYMGGGFGLAAQIKLGQKEQIAVFSYFSALHP